ncbi:hypothetical protein [Streptococcus sp. CSL10205-OR2]|uniref:hypothetical protein n=1 Tax=Streptococcus sp. CSL10205-OR2 TaxID=2980558 RepID=UPI0021DA9648|nr:hypothetical protein [Streptococcus sp. CSL10205-OR2]MCU9532992.1 hypothetical protein [Streptococcus sp. CSL10205-OR2]
MKIRTFLMSAALGFYAYTVYQNRDQIKEEANEMEDLWSAGEKSLEKIKQQLETIKIEKEQLDDVTHDLKDKLEGFKQEAQTHIEDIKKTTS